jgi:ribosome recycling factor
MSRMRRTMADAVEHLKRDLAALDPGRASPALLDRVRVSAYGSELPLVQVAHVTAQPPRALLVTAHDPSLAPAIERAMAQANLGAMPSSDGARVRLELPPPTAERRTELARTAKDLAERARVAVRLARRDAVNELRRDAASGKITTARMNGRSKDAQAAADEHVGLVNDALTATLRALEQV